MDHQNITCFMLNKTIKIPARLRIPARLIMYTSTMTAEFEGSPPDEVEEEWIKASMAKNMGIGQNLAPIRDGIQSWRHV